MKEMLFDYLLSHLQLFSEAMILTAVHVFLVLLLKMVSITVTTWLIVCSGPCVLKEFVIIPYADMFLCK